MEKLYTININENEFKEINEKIDNLMFEIEGNLIEINEPLTQEQSEEIKRILELLNPYYNTYII